LHIVKLLYPFTKRKPQHEVPKDPTHQLKKPIAHDY
jgi:hypothetical protein